jgi:membrane fusion protein (multidrug efflux system)
MSQTIESPHASAQTAAPHRRRGRGKRWAIAIVVLVAIFAVLAGIKVVQIKTMIDAGKKMVPPPEAVASAEVSEVDWQPTQAAVGTLVAFHGVTLSAELTGTVREINFENGALVKKGAVLVRFDTSTEEAQLQSAQADATLTKTSLERQVALKKSGVSPQSDLDAAQARDLQARALVSNLEATINKKVIRAPFDGRLGIRSVELGQVVSPGQPIVTLQSVSPIYAEFQLPQQALARVKLGQTIALGVDVFPGANWQGQVTTINPEVDPNTRNVRMRATVPNPDGRLTPGMFATVEVQSGERTRALVVPATGVLYAPYGDSVYVIEKPKEGEGPPDQLVAHQRFVRLGERRGDFVAVVSGVKAGETVVSAGAFKLRNGQAVKVNNAQAPTPEMTPAPSER